VIRKTCRSAHQFAGKGRPYKTVPFFWKKIRLDTDYVLMLSDAFFMIQYAQNNSILAPAGGRGFYSQKEDKHS